MREESKGGQGEGWGAHQVDVAAVRLAETTTRRDSPQQAISFGRVKDPSFARVRSKVKDTQNNEECFGSGSVTVYFVFPCKSVFRFSETQQANK